MIKQNKKYEGWQYLIRLISFFIYLFGLISILNPRLISAKDIPWFVALASFFVATLGLIISYLWESVTVYDTYMVKVTGIGGIYKKELKVQFEDILAVYGLKPTNKDIYIISSNVEHWLAILKSDINNLSKFEECLQKKSVSKEEFIKILKNQNKYMKGDDRYIRALP